MRHDKKRVFARWIRFSILSYFGIIKTHYPFVFSQNSYLVYVLQVPLLQSMSYHLYKLQPFPMKQQDEIFVYIETMKDFIFTDAMRQKYGKLSHPELQTCFKPNELTSVCKEVLPILTYVPHEDCEATLIHPSTIVVPNHLCEQRLLNLEFTYWIPLHLSNEWLYVTPDVEIFTVLCGNEKFQITLQSRGRLSLPPRCKGYSTHTTLYALSTLTHNNSKEDVFVTFSSN